MLTDVSENHIAPLHDIWFYSGLFLGLFFDPEDGGDMFLRNVITTAVRASNRTKLVRFEIPMEQTGFEFYLGVSRMFRWNYCLYHQG
jgi:hypothetical protein